MTMIHSVIARDKKKNILQIITCFSERQVPIARRFIEKDFPGAIITVKSAQDHPDTFDQHEK